MSYHLIDFNKAVNNCYVTSAIITSMKNKLSTEPIVVVDEQHAIPRRKGNGVLRYYLTVDKSGNLLRYSLAYINRRLCTIDNGRVAGYDNDHGFHHKHCMGTVTPVNFQNYQAILEQFEQEWRKYHESK